MHVVPVLLLVAACGFQAPERIPQDPSDPSVDAPPAVEPPPVPTADAPPALTPEALVVQMVTLECQAAFSCKPEYPASARPFDEEWGTDLDDCIATDRDYRMKESIAASCAAGVIAWDPAAAQMCFANPGVPTSCTSLFSDRWAWADSCLAALAGTVTDGGSCQNDWECAGRYSDCRGGECMH
jgi:hypothetical protein